jgi:hypothetical protein
MFPDSRREGPSRCELFVGSGRVELRLLEPGRAELQFLVSDADREELAASGILVGPKPIPLTKQ